ncbi:hypothetical protein [Desulfatiglans anilini]|uniref:hypothetical protein n=1 Tax=Desulfatiglans anilini TaxID=90728 RepID=UPI0004265911|nr:hypothetical protein [Desulfatiglans anilini]
MDKTEASSARDPAPGGNRLGTFGGVFTPSILTILGVIMFMRSGFVAGQAGIFQALLILLLAKSITTLTSLSISAVSTNTPVAGGGAYFLISRALGPEFGGAIGLALFLAQAVSVPFYILGFSEALVRTLPALAPYYRSIALSTGLVLFTIAYVGANWAIKTQYLIMSVLALSILAFMGGAVLHFKTETFLENWHAPIPAGLSFWSLFAIYFPAVTGIMAGVNMSGDLKEPGRSIPIGTFAAIGVGLLIYALQTLLLGGAQVRDELVAASYETMARQALFGAGFLVSAGVFAATLSSAISSFLGAPRVLQAIARDRIIPAIQPFAAGSARRDEPRRGLLLTLAVTVLIIILSGTDSKGKAFDILAAVVTMFFLYTYGMVNLAAFIESFSGNPSFRPRFKYYHWLPALCGAALCAGAAFLIDPFAAGVAVAALGAIYTLLRRRVLRVHFGDARWGFLYSRIRQNMLRLAKMPADPKNWRPTILVLIGNPEERRTIALYALWIGAERGLVTLARVLVGNLQELKSRRLTALEQLRRFLGENQFEALSTVVVSKTLDDGLSTLIQGHPFNPLRPNILLMGWSSDPERAGYFVRHLQSALALDMSLVLVKDKGLPRKDRPHRIDVWWRGQRNGSLMVLLAHLIHLNGEWSEARIRLLRLIPDEAGRKPSADALRALLDRARIEAEPVVLVSQAPFPDVLKRHSGDAAVVLLGFNVPEEKAATEFQANFEGMLAELPTSLLVCSSGEADVFV